MKVSTLIKKIKICKPFTFSILLFTGNLFLFSFVLNHTNEKFLAELGIGKTEANKKITESILGGYLNQSGLKNIKNISIAN